MLSVNAISCERCNASPRHLSGSLWKDLNLVHDLEVLGVALVSWRVEFDLQSTKYLEEIC